MMNNLPAMICFDMDGTIADLYGVENWLPMLRDFDPTPYEVAEPMWQMAELAEVLNLLRAVGVEIRIITWLSKESNPQYDAEVREAKRNWLAEQNFPFDHFHGVRDGATKADSIRPYLAENETAILFDDNAKVRNGWRIGEAYTPDQILEILKNIVGE